MFNETGLTIDTFCNRWFGCSYFKERNSYIRTATKIIKKSLRLSDGSDFLEVFSKVFSSRRYSGLERIYSDHKKNFRDFTLECAINIDKLIKNSEIIKREDSYNYKWKIKGTIDAVLKINDKIYNLIITLYSYNDVQEILDRAKFNNYLYNEVNSSSNNCIVFSAQSNSFYVLYYQKGDFSLNRGFITQVQKNKQKVPSAMCKFCKNKCKPVYLKGLEQLKNWEI